MFHDLIRGLSRTSVTRSSRHRAARGPQSHLSAHVQLLETRQLLAADPVVVDNSDAAYSDVRDWQTVAGEGHNGGISVADQSVAGALASWNFSGLDNGQYYLQATWTSGADRATNAKFTAVGSRQFVVNQRVAPLSDFQSGSSAFQTLGVVTVRNGSLTVELANPGADGKVVADAVRLDPVASTDNSLAVRTERLKEIALGLHAFHNTYRHFPPVAVPAAMDANGQFLSWRVHLLPFLGHGDLYQRFHLNEAWDSPHNSSLLSEMPDVLRSLDLPAGSGMTGFQRVDIAGGFHIYGSGGPTLQNVADNWATSLLLVETAADKAVAWTAPNDTPYSPQDPSSIITPNAEGLTLAAMANGSVRHLNQNISAADFLALATWSGGEVVSAARAANIFIDPPSSADQASQQKLKELMFAMHSFHEVHDTFPPVEGDSSTAAQFDANGNPYLSWRVYLLPYLGENALFKKFRLDEPWNSPNNLPLIDQMPEVFRSVGVAAGSTVTGYQVFNGPGAYQMKYGLDRPIRDVQDGTSNTLAIVELPSSSAVTWTRPDGDVPFDPANPLAGIGPIPAQGLWGAMFDLSVRRISPQITGANLAALVTWNGGEVLAAADLSNAFVDYPAPETIAQRTQKLRQIGLALHNYHDRVDSFPVSGSRDKYDASGKPFLSWRVHLLPYIGHEDLFNQFHLNEAWDSPHNLSLLDKMPEIYRSRGLAVGTNRTGFQLLTGPAAYNQPLPDAFSGRGPRIRDVHDNTESTILVLETQASQAVEWTRPDGDIPFDPANPLAGLDLSGLENVIADGLLAVMVDGRVRTIRPAITAGNFAALATWRGEEVLGAADINHAFFEPEMPLPVVNAHTASQNKLKLLGLALHNYRDVYREFPVSNVDPQWFDASGKPKLSWRVHVLPYLGEEALYEQFHLDEAWDSPHNLPLLSKMPEVFRSRGLAADATSTGFQFISGPGAYDSRVDRSLSMNEITDGTSNTIGIIETAPELAVAWTKPDDFPFNPADPFAGLRSVMSDYVLAVMFDGSVDVFHPLIAPADAAALITWAGKDTSKYELGSLTAQILVRDSSGATFINETNTALFGATDLGAPVLKTFTVGNGGSQPLVISSVELPAGFTMTTPLPGPIAPGASASISIRMDAAAAGIQDGFISLNTNVPDQPVLKFGLYGSVATAWDLSITNDSAPENLPAGTIVGTLSTTDPFNPAPYAYALVSGEGSEDNSSFTIDAAGNLRTAASFNFEAKSSYSIRVRTTDGEGLAFEKALTIRVTNVNEEPVIGNFGSAVSYIENGAPKQLMGSATVVDPDSADFASGQLTVKYTSGGQSTDRLAILDQGNLAGQIGVSGNEVRYGDVPIGMFTGGIGTTPLVVTFNSSASRLAVQATLRRIAYSNVSDNPGSTPRVVNFQLTDGDGGTSAEVAKTVNVTAVNDAPVIGNFGSAVSYIENGAPKPLMGSATVADPDSLDFASGKLMVKYASGGQSTDRLTILNQGNLAGQIGVSGNELRYGNVLIGTFTGGVGTTPLAVTFNSNASRLAVQSLLRRIAYSSTSDDPNSTSRVLSFTLTDGDGGTTLPVEKTVNVVAVNDVPVIGNFGSDVSYVENGAPKQLMGSATVADPDSQNFENGKLTVKYASGGQGTDRLTILNQGNLAGQIGVSGNELRYGNVLIGTFTGGVGTTQLVVTFNGSATRLAVQALLRRIAYSNASDNPGSTPRVLSFQLTDGDGGTSAAVVKTVNVTPVNDAPVIGNFGSDVSYAENGAPKQLMGSATVADPDSVNFENGKLTVKYTSGGQSTDRLTILNQGNLAGQIGVSGNELRYGNVLIGTFTGGVGTTPLVVTFNSNASRLAVQALLRRIAFSNVSDDPSTTPRVVSFQLTDGDGGVSPAASTTVNVSPVAGAARFGIDGAFVDYEGWAPAMA